MVIVLHNVFQLFATTIVTLIDRELLSQGRTEIVFKIMMVTSTVVLTGSFAIAARQLTFLLHAFVVTLKIARNKSCSDAPQIRHWHAR